MADRDFPHASLSEGLRFTALVALPNLVQGLFLRRRRAVAIAGTLGADRRAVAFMRKLKRRYGDGPLWIRVAKDPVLLVLGRDAIRSVLEASPDPFAADPEPKRTGMEHFQPYALTISRGEDWKDRRRFTEAVLDTEAPVHRFAARIAAVSAEEAAQLPSQLDWPVWNKAVRRATRRVILGEPAAGDDQISEMLGELMDKSNPPGKGDPELYERYLAKLESYVEGAAPDGIVGLFGEAPVSERTQPAGQVTHWLFALGDTLAVNAFRCLALLATHDTERERALAEPPFMDACIQEAMRLWPTTAMLSRQTVGETKFAGGKLPAETQVLIVNAFNHRDPDSFEFADRFAPEQWLSGDAGADWSFNHFSHGPQACPGAGVALLVGRTMLGRLLRDHTARLLDPARGRSGPLPHALDHFALRFELSGK